MASPRLLASCVFAALAVIAVHAGLPGGRRDLQSSSVAGPPPGFDALTQFNISAFISAPWFVQQQVIWA